MRIRTLLLPTLLLVCLSIVAYVVYAKSRLNNAGHQAQGFTLHIKQTAFPTNGSGPIVFATRVRYQKGDGSWKTVTTYSDGRLVTQYGQPGRGVFDVNHADQKLVYVGAPPSTVRSEEFWKQQAGYIGEETILGFRTLHIRNHEGGGINDFYICPQLQNYPLKAVSTPANDAQNVREVTHVVLGEPSFDAMPDYPVDTARFEQIHKNLGNE